MRACFQWILQAVLMDFTWILHGYNGQILAVVGHLATPQAFVTFFRVWQSMFISRNTLSSGWRFQLVHPEPWGNDPIWLIFFEWVETVETTNWSWHIFFQIRIVPIHLTNFENVAPNLWMLGKLYNNFPFGDSGNFAGANCCQFSGVFQLFLGAKESWKKLKNSKLSWSKVSGQSCQCTSKCQHYRQGSARARKRRTEFPHGSCGVVVT